MSGYSVNNEMGGSIQTLTSTYKTVARVGQPAAAPKRVRVWELELSASSVPNATDCPVQGDLSFCDATGGAFASNGTSTAVTAQSMDGGVAIGTQPDVAITLAGVNYTAEPTTVSQAHSWWVRAFNQRSGVLWQAQPGREIVVPATVSVGPCLRALSSNYAGGTLGRINFDEL